MHGALSQQKISIPIKRWGSEEQRALFCEIRSKPDDSNFQALVESGVIRHRHNRWQPMAQEQGFSLLLSGEADREEKTADFLGVVEMTWAKRFCGAVGVGLALLGCGGGGETEPPPASVPTESSSGTRVDVVEMVASSSELQMSMLGSVEASRDAELSTTRGGYVEAIHVKAGDRVSRGTKLASVDAELHRVLLEQATAQEELADAEYKRALGLGDLISEAQLQATETQLEIAKANRRQAELHLERSTVVAPFAGQIGAVHTERGEVLGPGMPVLRLVSLDTVIVRLNVTDRDVVSLERGMAAQIHLQAVATPFSGSISNIAPVADSDTRAFQVEVAVKNSQRKLLPGMIARVELGREMPAESVLIPQEWVVTGLNTQGVYVVEDATAVWREVELGEVVRDQVVVSTGVGVGDRVVVNGHRSLADGDDVLVAREGRCCEAGRVLY